MVTNVGANKRPASASDPQVPAAKRANQTASVGSNLLALTAWLKDIGTSIDSVMNRLVNLPCQDPAARSQLVTTLSQVLTSINGQLGVRKTVSLAVIHSGYLGNVGDIITQHFAARDRLPLRQIRFSSFLDHCRSARQRRTSRGLRIPQP